MAEKKIQIALVGNPNSGKTSLFNALTGLHQQVGNFPGVTVDKKIGTCRLSNNIEASLIDLPGTYSLFPRRNDERVAYRVLMGMDAGTHPEIILLVVDASNLKRNLLFCSQLIDLKYPVVIALTMLDIAAKKGIKIDVNGLQADLGVPVIQVNPRKDRGIAELRKVLAQMSERRTSTAVKEFIDVKNLAPAAIAQVKQIFPHLSDYGAIHYLVNHEHFSLSDIQQQQVEQAEIDNKFNATKVQAEDVLQRYAQIKKLMDRNVRTPDPLQQKLFTEKLDNILLHRFWGYVILFFVLFLLFQSIFWLASYPMDAIDNLFSAMTARLDHMLPKAWWSDLIVNGLLAGLGGIVIFVPQIMILFGLTTILEDTGYMARISFLSDKLMRKVGLNGKSVMPMISGFACAVPAIMSARNIENQKERLLTILVTPLMSCSARLPVFVILTGLIVPDDKKVLGFMSMQGIIMMALYLMGIVMALIVSYVFSLVIKIKEKSFFILELPIYRAPRWKNIGITMVEKSKIFVTDAGRVILVISLVLWFMSSYGPAKQRNKVEQQYAAAMAATPSTDSAKIEEIQLNYGNAKLESSYVGILGKSIEPVIRPLGFDWKIGIALITSFAAREVFVGTMATLYSVESDDDITLQQKMDNAVWPDGRKVYTVPTALSLLVFYVLAMQCMSTLAIVKRETKSWKWPVIQFSYMTVLAYVCSFIVFHLFS